MPEHVKDDFWDQFEDGPAEPTKASSDPPPQYGFIFHSEAVDSNGIIMMNKRGPAAGDASNEEVNLDDLKGAKLPDTWPDDSWPGYEAFKKRLEMLIQTAIKANKDKKEAQAKVKELEEKNKKLEEEKTKLEKRAQDAEGKVAAAEKTAKEANDKVAAAEKKAKEAEDKIAAADKKAKEAEDKIAAAEKKAKEAEDKAAAADRRAAEAERSSGTLRADRDKYKAWYDAEAAKVRGLEQERDKWKKAAGDKDHRITQLENRIRDLEKRPHGKDPHIDKALYEIAAYRSVAWNYHPLNEQTEEAIRKGVYLPSSVIYPRR